MILSLMAMNNEVHGAKSDDIPSVDSKTDKFLNHEGSMVVGLGRQDGCQDAVKRALK